MPQQKTLFSFFTKQPATPKAGAVGGDNSKVLQSKSEKNSAAKSPSPVKGPACQFDLLDVVWAKLEGYPWWPSIVCNHPAKNIHHKGGKQPQIHVQFFDNPPSRAWIKEKYVKVFEGSESKDFQRGGRFFSANTSVRKGVEEADEALKKGKDERRGLIVNPGISDDEDDENGEVAEEDEDEEDDEVMEVDKFDDDIFEKEMDSSKENNNKKTPKKSPRKASSRPSRSAAKPDKKRRRIISPDSEPEDSEDEYNPGKVVSSEEESDLSSGVDEDEISNSDSPSDPESPVKTVGVKRKRPSKPAPRTKTQHTLKTFSTPASKSKASSPSTNSTPSTPSSGFTPAVGEKTKSRLAAFSALDTPTASGGDSQETRHFLHLGLDFIKPEHVRDINKRRPDDAEYDARTLHIPDSFLSKQTPAMRQWWLMKAKHYDTVLFFKMGKFYELFHMDSVIGVNELGLIYMKGEHAHSGFPEIAYGRYADTLIQKGYKVARIEQTETPQMMGERVASMGRMASKLDKVVRREICSVQTKGTKRYSFIDGDSSDAASAYLLAVCERGDCASETGAGPAYGVCFIDTTVGKFHVGQFEDDRHCSRFRTLLSHHPPAHILYERGKLSEKTNSVLNSQLVSTLRDSLKPGSEFWDSNTTLKFLSQGDYFLDEKEAEGDGSVKWPEALKRMISDTDTLGHTAAEDYDLAVSALGAVTWYLQESLLDQELLSMRNFGLYVPLDNAQSSTTSGEAGVPSFATGRQHMVLDGVTLSNLDILENSSTGTLEGTLLQRLDQCATPFGKRVFKQWLCAPLCNPIAINDRLDAVEDLMGSPQVVSEVTEMMHKLPDLERLLSKIHTLGSASRSKNHPDSRAVFFEAVTYSKRKIEDFLATLEGFKLSMKIIKKFSGVVCSFKSKLLRQTVSIAEGDTDTSTQARFPDLGEQLDFFDNAFNHQKARSQGVINPSKGVNLEYDTALADIASTQRQLDQYLDTQKKRLGCRNLAYWGTGKNRFQIEVPDSATKNVPDDYTLTSSKKTARRYHTPELLEFLEDMTNAEERRDTALKDTMRRIFAVFDENYRQWDGAVQCLSVLDALLCLTQYSQCGEGALCRPELVLPGLHDTPFIEIREGRHPCISRTFSGGDFIPNDTVVGIADESDAEEGEAVNKHSRVVLVTGPNMGGKSTLMRQVGVIVIMAQLGCYVPAETCRLTPVDRVFTRLGASDRIMAGESTFFVELSETSAILQHATKHSLVLLDELGRGTATYDGTAIACAVVNDLSQNIACRTLFSTHYHSLVEEFSHDPNVRLGHMACMVENDNEEDPSLETIIFLYKFVKGACPKSYGFNAARLADIPEEVIKVAREKAHLFEETVDKLRQFRELYKASETAILEKIQKL